MIDIETLLVPRCLAGWKEDLAGLAFLIKGGHRETVIGAVAARCCFTSAAQDTVLFLLDHQEFAHIIQSARGVEYLEMPYLPYEALAFECTEDATWIIKTSDEKKVVELQAFTVREIEPEVWDCALLVRDHAADKLPPPLPGITYYAGSRDPDNDVPDDGLSPDRLMLVRITRDEVKMFEPMGNQTWIEFLAQSSHAASLLPATPLDPDLIRELVYEAVQLVDARGVELEEIPAPRPARRRAQRAGYTLPETRVVRIVGERKRSWPGDGGRRYYHRWWVRGHWRHFEDGDRTWVKAHVKGPAGGPWLPRGPYAKVPRR